MSHALDLPSIQRAVDDIDAQLLRCDNGEGMVCSHLDLRIQCQAKHCLSVRNLVRRWYADVFAGRAAPDDVVEQFLKNRVQIALRDAVGVAAAGRASRVDCFDFGSLNQLHYGIADLSHFLAHWVSPRLAVAPAPRTAVPAAAAAEIADTLRRLGAATR